MNSNNSIVSDWYLYLLVDNLIDDSIKAHNYYYTEVLAEKQKNDLRAAYEADRLRMLNNNLIK